MGAFRVVVSRDYGGGGTLAQSGLGRDPIYGGFDQVGFRVVGHMSDTFQHSQIGMGHRRLKWDRMDV